MTANTREWPRGREWLLVGVDACVVDNRVHPAGLIDLKSKRLGLLLTGQITDDRADTLSCQRRPPTILEPGSMRAPRLGDHAAKGPPR